MMKKKKRKKKKKKNKEGLFRWSLPVGLVFGCFVIISRSFFVVVVVVVVVDVDVVVVVVGLLFTEFFHTAAAAS